jgi:GNAT superfamily N-acetyltransferase
MTDTPIRIEHICIKDLISFAEQTLAHATPESFIPLTMQRAVAHTHNPYADPDDIGLLVAYDGDELVGYFGILPILLKRGEAFEKVHWFSTWLISPKLRGKSVGSLLMQEALTLGQDYVIVGSSPARKVSRKFGFYECAPLEYYELEMTGMSRLNPLVWFLRFERKLLHPLGVKVAITNGFSETFARRVGSLTKGIFYRLLSPPKCRISCKEVSQVREETPEQRANLPKVCLYRGPKAVNWMLRYPWVVEPGQSQTEGLDYYFSDVRDQFRQIALEITSPLDSAYKGYMVLSVSTVRQKTELKVLDISLADPADEQAILPIVLRYGREAGADMIVLPKRLAEPLEGSWLGRLLLHKKLRTTQVHPKGENSPLELSWREMELNYCDGDMAFS